MILFGLHHFDLVSLGMWMINGSALVGLAGRLDGSFQLLPHDLHSAHPPPFFPHFVGRQASLIGASQGGQNKKETEQLRNLPH